MTTLTSPVWGGAAYQITQPYGPTTLTVEPLLNGQHFHSGIDIGIPLRTPLFSPVAGKVVHVSYALWAVTDLVRCYWLVHVDSSVVTLGQWVSKGQLVAYSGNKVPSGGASTGPHLHFEVQNYPGARLSYYDENNGRFIVVVGALNNPATSLNPLPYLTGLASAQTGGLEDDLTPEEHNALFDIRGSTAIRNPVTTDALRTILAQALTGFTVTAPPVNLAPILDAITTLQQHGDPVVRDAIAKVEAHLNAPRPPA